MKFSRPLLLAIGAAWMASAALGVSFVILPCTANLVTLRSTSPTASGTYICPKFDPSMGALFAVHVGTVSGSLKLVSGSYTVQNNTASTLTSLNLANPFAVAQITFLDLPGMSSLISAPVPGFYTGVLSVAPGSFQSLGVLSDLLSVLGHSSDLQAYTGPGSLTLSYALSSRLLANVPGVAIDYSFLINPAPGIVYEFNEVPEPSTAALALAGLGLLVGAVARRHP